MWTLSYFYGMEGFLLSAIGHLNMKQEHVTLKRPTDKPSSIIQRALAVYMNNERSLNPQDILQSIEAAQIMKDAAEQALKDAETKRRELIETLGGKLAA